MSNLGQTLLIPSKSDSGVVATEFAAPTMDRRIFVSAVNTSGYTLHDHVLTVALPAGHGIDSTSAFALDVDATTKLRIDPAGSLYVIDKSVNRGLIAPITLSGNTLKIKARGKWTTGSPRAWHVYWSTTSLPAATSYSHLGGASQGWTAAITAGTTGDHYILICGGVTFDYTMTVGQTAAQIGAALAALINAGSVATATGTGTLTVKQTSVNDLTFTVVNTGTTVPGNLVVTQPGYFGIARIGPDNQQWVNTNRISGLPYKLLNSGAAVRVGWGFNTNRILRAGQFSKNVGGAQIANTCTITALSFDALTGTATGTIGYASNEVTAAYSETYTQHLFSGIRTDNTLPNTMLKNIDVHDITFVMTWGTGYAPTTVSAAITTASAHEVFSLSNLDDGFSGIYDASNQIKEWYSALADPATLTTVVSPVDLSALPVVGTIFGTAGGSTTMAIRVLSAAFGGDWSNQPSKQLYWATGTNDYAFLCVRGLTSAATIPAGATITVRVLFAIHNTNSATSVGDALIPSEINTFIAAYDHTPTVTVGTTERMSASALVTSTLNTLRAASVRSTAGLLWFQTNKATYGGNVHNLGYTYNTLKTACRSIFCDDVDGSMGVGYALHGLCLRYLRTHDASLVAMIEACAQYFLDAEADLVAQTGYAFWQGAVPHTYVLNDFSSVTYLANSEGGITFGPAGNTDPGGRRNIVYTQGQVRVSTSTDQIHAALWGLYAYLYMLRNESAITANTTLRTNLRSFLTRCIAFQTANDSSYMRTSQNLADLYDSLTPTRPNGVNTTYVNIESSTTFANPYYGDLYSPWLIANGTVTLTPSGPEVGANTAMIVATRAVMAPNSTKAGLARYLIGVVTDQTTRDHGMHEYLQTAGLGTIALSPIGWQGRQSTAATVYNYSAVRPNRTHWVTNTGNIYDQLGARMTQRICDTALALMCNGETTIPYDTDSAGVTDRTISLTDYLRRMVQVAAAHVIDPTTGATRASFGGWSGGKLQLEGADNIVEWLTPTIDATTTGYSLCAWEMAFMALTGANVTDYYRVA